MQIKIIFILAFLLMANLAAQEENCSQKGCHSSFFEKENIHPVLEEGCTSCHEGNETSHPDSSTTQFSLLETIPDLCYECHDQKDNLPQLHPPVEEGACLDCHDPHSSDASGLLLATEQEVICFNCHEPEQGKSKHEPYKDGDCLNCHDPHQSVREKLLITERPELCFECHDDIKEAWLQEESHPPVKEGDCSDCHLPHVSANKKLLTAEPPMLCLDCHESEEQKVSSSFHGPLNNKMACLNCHVPHGSSFEHLFKEEVNQLCLSCHNAQNQKAPDIASLLTQDKFIHEPLREDNCLTCHSAHGNLEKMLLNNEFPSGAYGEHRAKSYSLCFDCHDEALMDPANKQTGFRNGRMNLHALHVNRDKSRSCVLCHNVHGAENRHLIADKVRFGQWQMPLRFQSTPNGGSCAPGCHEAKKYKR